jgi:hypothetical protein
MGPTVIITLFCAIEDALIGKLTVRIVRHALSWKYG